MRHSLRMRVQEVYYITNYDRLLESVIIFNVFPQEVGYRGEIGYQTFLYSNEAEIRKLFMFLVENLPKESSESASEPLGKFGLSGKQCN